jgi:HlyD family secretion protein
MAVIDTNKSLRRFQIAGYVSIAIMLGVGGVWAATSNINGAVIAPATIVVESYSKKIQHKEGGIVREILVRDGDQVEAGQMLVKLDDTETKAELGIINALLLEGLSKRSRLEAQRDGADAIEFPEEVTSRADDPAVAKVLAGQVKLFEARREALRGKKDQFNQQMGQLNEQIAGLVSQREAKERQLELIADEVKNLRKLQKQGLVPVSRVLAMDREAARLDGERGELIANRAQAESRIGEVKIQILQIDEQARAETLTELRDAESRVAELQERKLAASSRLSRMDIKSPIAGDIYQVNVHTVGGVIAPGEAIMLIVPKGDDLVLQAQVMPQDIDQVAVGQFARVRFPAFVSRTTPEVDAKVLQVSADTSRVDANTPPFYAVRIGISAKELERLGDNVLKPGMPAEAFIQTEARTPLSYFLKPLADQIAHALRET